MNLQFAASLQPHYLQGPQGQLRVTLSKLRVSEICGLYASFYEMGVCEI